MTLYEKNGKLKEKHNDKYMALYKALNEQGRKWLEEGYSIIQIQAALFDVVSYVVTGLRMESFMQSWREEEEKNDDQA